MDHGADAMPRLVDPLLSRAYCFTECTCTDLEEAGGEEGGREGPNPITGANSSTTIRWDSQARNTLGRAGHCQQTLARRSNSCAAFHPIIAPTPRAAFSENRPDLT